MCEGYFECLCVVFSLRLPCVCLVFSSMFENFRLKDFLFKRDFVLFVWGPSPDCRYPNVRGIFSMHLCCGCPLCLSCVFFDFQNCPFEGFLVLKEFGLFLFGPLPPDYRYPNVWGIF